MTFEQQTNQFTQLKTELSEVKSLLIKSIDNKEVEQLLNVKECASLLDISVPTLYGYTQKSEIPFSKKGKKLIFFRSEIMSWIKTFRHKSNKEVEMETQAYLSNNKKGGING